MGAVSRTFSRRLQAHREVAGLSQSGLAAKSGVSLGTIHDYEQGRSGKYGPSLETAVKLARALGQPLEAFLPSAAEDASAVKPSGKRRRQESGEPPQSAAPKKRTRKGKSSADA